MPRTPARVTQADISRAWRVALASNPPAVVEVLTDGTIRIVPRDLCAPAGDSGDKPVKPVDVRERPVL